MLGVALAAASAALLDEFVNAEPAFIDYKMLPEFDLEGEGKGRTAGLSWTAKCVNLTSQAWMSEADWGADWGGANAHWWHYMFIITPSEIKSDSKDWRTLYITNGKNSDPVPGKNNENIGGTAELAMTTGQVFVTLLQVPNVPIYLKTPDGTQTRAFGDDDLLANTFVHYMDYIKAGGTNAIEDKDSLGAASWVVILPMVKAGFAAMAAAESILGDTAPAKWAVTGASKRGWTAWLVGAVDMARDASNKRVQGIAPIVLDGVHFEKTLKLHYEAYGGWSFAMRAFLDAGFTGRIDSEEIKPLWELIDPYYYMTRYKGLPKLVCNALGDEWFLPDDSRYWYNEMKEFGPLSLVMVPDAEHSMATGLPSLIPTIGSFVSNLAANRESPHFTWEIDYGHDEKDASIVVTIDSAFVDMPRTVQMWHSATCHKDTLRRDFRLVNLDAKTMGDCPCGPKLSDTQCFNLHSGIWANSTLTADASDSTGATYIAQQKVPSRALERWEGFFVTVTFHGAAPDSAATGNNTPADGGDGCMQRLGDRRVCVPVVSVGDMMLASQVVIVPDYRPHQCYGEQCTGTLL